MDEQYAKPEKSRKLSYPVRLVYALVFIMITAGFAVLWFTEKGFLDLGFFLGVCGFKQRFNIPCPGCGWTHAAQAFVTGQFKQAFWLQPAAAVFCALAILVAVFALLFAIIGVDFDFPKRVFSATGTKLLLIAATVVILAGWMVTLVRTILDNTEI
ncbi:MAG: DUF2752 domain-containing protein [Planctomycetaceae bacterium]|nr:DUF2752 domain-containing protein [Planctomycetaceae bacterium]